MSAGTPITFYSYKGGVGRTMTLANVACLLARWGRKVLCIDWYLEAPGLDLYLRNWLRAPAETDGPASGLLETLIHYRDAGGDLPWSDHLTAVDIGDGVTFDLLAAGGRSADYERRLHGIDWSALYAEHDFGNALERARDAWMDAYDFILIDSRTGISDIGGICTVQLPDILVLLGTANRQNLDGLTRVLSQVDASRRHFDLERSRILAVPVLSRFERQAEYKDSEAWLGRYVEAFTEAVRLWVPNEVPVKRVLSSLAVPYIPYWSFGERMPVLEKGTDDDTDIGWHFETLARLLDGRLADADALLLERGGPSRSDTVRLLLKALSQSSETSHVVLEAKDAPNAGRARDVNALLRSLTAAVQAALPSSEPSDPPRSANEKG